MFAVDWIEAVIEPYECIGPATHNAEGRSPGPVDR
jgi:hypothetical protein